ncbi:hypothetical protein BDV98DRAFT_569401 [Pterulicium gracile]|uniref:Uncharacterized protein n=1 Tax=Pterulicium gracile TaxID=1884261 RepID=A0A5C3QG36_9AGAR|nr:hypothetical protein BDV98DRAFT_569401 [Pterula gracilis]
MDPDAPCSHFSLHLYLGLLTSLGVALLTVYHITIEHLYPFYSSMIVDVTITTSNPERR